MLCSKPFGLTRYFCAILCTLFCTNVLFAQMFSVPSKEGRETTTDRALSVGRINGVYNIRAALPTGTMQTLRYDPMTLYYGVLQTSGIVITGAIGTVNACDTGAACEYQIKDFHAASVSGIPLNRSGRNRFSVPIGLVLDFRRSGPKDQFNAPGSYFGVTAAQLATGLAGEFALGRRTELKIRGMAGGGLALQTQDSGLGLARQYEAMAELRFANLIGRYGVVVGADLRGFDWDVRYTGLQFESAPQKTNYSGKQLGFRAGISF